MKRIFFLQFAILTSTLSFGQTFSTLGVGTTTPVGTLHVHSSVGIAPPAPPVVNNGPRSVLPSDYQTILHVTNTFTGLEEMDGFTIDQYNGSVTIHQYEQANVSLLGHQGLGFTLTPSGNFGLGTSSPNSRLHVNGNALIEGTFMATSRTCIGSDCQVLTIGKAHTNGMNAGTTYLGFNAQSNGSMWTSQSDGTDNGGAVIWGNIFGDILFANIPSNNSNSSQSVTEDALRSHINLRLGADGTLIAKEIMVSLTGWPDYVFGEGYNLMTLNEIKQFIDTNGHLPNVPSAAEVEANGLSVGEMNKVLLQKVEELTLYVIELQKQILELKQE